MTTDYARELDEELAACKAALQGQAQAMLDLLFQFEAHLQKRLEVAQAQIDAIRAESEHAPGPARDSPEAWFQIRNVNGRR